jgi:hypothetical protein
VPGHVASPVIGGQPSTGDLAVVAIRGPDYLCSGTLITNRIVLTARHCLAATKATDIRAFFGSSLRRVDGGLPPDAGVFIQGAAHRYSQAGDIGVFLLSQAAPPGVQPIPLAPAGAIEGFVHKTARVVGFGKTAPLDADGPAGTKHTGTVEILFVGPAVINAGPGPSMICSGDSGGALLIDIDGGEYLAGDTAFGDDACGTSGQFPRTDAYHAELVGPFLAEMAEGAAALGSRCYYPEHCGGGTTCTASTEVTGASYCSTACGTASHCARGMTCTAGQCAYPGPATGRVGTPCRTAAECPSGLCINASCATRCFPDLDNTCPSGSTCAIPTGDPGAGFVCTTTAAPKPPSSGGCMSAGGLGGLAAALAALLALGLLRARRRAPR